METPFPNCRRRRFLIKTEYGRQEQVGETLQTKKVRYNDRKQRQYPDPAHRQHYLQSKSIFQGGRYGHHGGQNYAADPARGVGITARLWYDECRSEERRVGKECAA